jgi:isoquinoline 1-oxidoreductase subunit beta
MSFYIQRVTRRDALQGMFSAGALVLGAKYAPAATDSVPASWWPTVYLGIEPDGRVVIVAHRSEMGTGIRTALPMIAADELDADWKQVKVQQAIGDAKYGSQDTDGSQSIREFYEALRKSGATARLLLQRAAAQKWNVSPEECSAKDHKIVHLKSGRIAGFGELAVAAAAQPMPREDELRYKSPADYKYIGKGVPIIDQNDIVSGKAIFGQDARVPGMVYASIERSPVIGGKLNTVDDTEAKKVRGVLETVTLDSAKPPYLFQALGGVAVIGDSTWSAMQGRKKLKIDWTPGDNASYNSTDFKAKLQATVLQPQKSARSVGDVDAEFAKGGKIVEAEYYAPHLAHASMEPPAAVADFRDGKVEVWTCTQNPQAVQQSVGAALNIDQKKVICHVTLLGGGFGRKSKPDYAVEAALLSKKLGKPVKVVWTREDDIHFDYYHSVAAMYFKAATDEKGRPTAWLQRSAFPPLTSTFVANAEAGSAGELGMGFMDIPFQVPNLRVENGPAKAHIRIGWLRSVANVYHAYGIQSFTDELAAAANRDRVEYLLDLIGQPRKIDFAAEGTKYPNYGKPLNQFPVDTARLRRVIEIAAEQSGWAKKKPSKGRALGIAAHRSFLSYVAAVVEVEVDDRGRVRIPRVDIAVDAGQIIHPDRVKSQFEGAAVFGTSLALMGEITAANGVIQQSNFHNYPVARMNEAPYETHVHLVNSTEPPAGVGEPGVPPIAPAICNAIFAATGKRVRELPIKRTKLV